MVDPNIPETPDGLATLLATEKKAIDEAPRVQVVCGPARRCSICGQPAPVGELEQIEPPKPGEPERLACKKCWEEIQPDAGSGDVPSAT